MPYKSLDVNHYRGPMGQNQPLEMSEEEKEDLSVGLLRSWLLEATQALVDVIGSEEALRLSKPYYQHAGMAARRVFQSITNLDLDGIAIARVGFRAHTSYLGGRVSPPYRASDGSEINERHGCATSGICEEACISICSILPVFWVKEMNPDWEIRLIRSLSWGDNCCQWKVWKSGTSPKVEAIEEMRLAPELVHQDPLDDDAWKNLGLAYVGENWVLATRAILDSPARERGIEGLQHRMRLYGLSVGLRARGRMPKQSGATAIHDIAKLISALQQRKGEIVLKDNRAEGTVMECPFAGSAPPEVCLQYQAFFNGICEAIDPDYEFVYDRMMTKGDKTCHWTIRKKDATGRAGAASSKGNDCMAALKSLAFKYAQGEIAKDEYDELKKLIQEN
jgi:predicted hydrocarbon binding protein